MTTMKIKEFLEARLAEDEERANDLMKTLRDEVEGRWAGVVDERGPMTPDRHLRARLWAHFAGQSPVQNFRDGQTIAYFAAPTRALAECAAKRSLMSLGSETVLESVAEAYSWHEDYGSWIESA